MSKTMIDHYRDGLGIQETLGYDDWKNQNKGKLKMTNGVESALDAAENQAMYKLYQQEIQASNAKNEALAGIEKNRAQALRENAVLTERAKEYAAKNAALRGVSNSGLSQTSMIDLMSQMAGVRADTQAQYDSQKQSVVQEYLNAINQAKSAASDTVGNVAIQKAANRENDENTLTELSKSYTDLSQLKTSAEEFKSKYGYVPESVTAEIKENSISNALDLPGITDTSAFISPSKISLENINALIDVSGKGEGDEQDEWVKEVVSKIKKGQIKDGTVIDMNYGWISGQNKGNYFVYHDGKLYQSDITFDEFKKMLENQEGQFTTLMKR